MQLHQLKPSRRKKRKVVGRGGSHGTYATRGLKGQKSKSGSYKGKSFEGTKMPLFRRTPKLRGFKSLYGKNNVVNISKLDEKFKDEDVIDPKILLASGLISKKRPQVKILGGGELKKKFIVSDCLVSKSAEEKIKKAGGEIRIRANA